MSLIDDHVDKCASRQLLVEAGSGEVHVARHKVAGLDEDLGDEVLGAASLVSGDDMPVAVVLPDGGLQVIEVPASRVSLVSQHEPGPLVVAHG